MVGPFVNAGSGDEDDLPELAAFVEARERRPGVGERVLGVDERLHTGLLEEGAHLAELVARARSTSRRTVSCRQNMRARSADGSGPLVAPATTTVPPVRSDFSE